MVISYHIGAGNQTRSSARTTAPNCWAISPGPLFSYWKENISLTLLLYCELPMKLKPPLLKMIRNGYLLLWRQVNNMYPIEAVLYIFALSSSRIMISTLYRCCIHWQQVTDITYKVFNKVINRHYSNHCKAVLFCSAGKWFKFFLSYNIYSFCAIILQNTTT